MPDQKLIVSPGPRPGTVRLADGRVAKPPRGWQLLPPGDGTLTRRVKNAGPTWTVKQRRGRREFSQGVWAPASTILEVREALEAERGTEAYAKKRAKDRARRDARQGQYVRSFTDAVFSFLDFALPYRDLALRLSALVAEHATPVGSGTVARTERIPIEQRAEAAVIAWLRHQTTAYDQMKISRQRGRRRETRRMLAEQSRALLEAYRRGGVVNPETCPLQTALRSIVEEGGADHG